MPQLQTARHFVCEDQTSMEMHWGSLAWIHMAQDSDQWWCLRTLRVASRGRSMPMKWARFMTAIRFIRGAVARNQHAPRRMASSGMLRRVAPGRSSYTRVTRISELGTTLGVISNRQTLRRNIKCVRRLLVTASVVPS
jgi:hypothetical protein